MAACATIQAVLTARPIGRIMTGDKMDPNLSSSLIGSPQRTYPGTGSNSGHRQPGKTMNKSAATLAKLSRPQLRGILSRDRLFSELDEGRDKSIIWVSGSPGSGKTTVVADYVDTWALDCVWYQVDQGDADVATFFYYMGQAVANLEDSSQNPLPTLSPQYHSNLNAFTRRYFRQLFSRLTAPFALVFDNYQDIPAQSRIHEVLREGLQEIPDGGCVIFISRADPPLSMARFRANQAMEFIGPEQLKLTREESDAIVELRGHKLSTDALQQLYEKTEGWAAGLVLMLGRADAEGAVEMLPADSTPEVVFDYLAGEIFKNFEPATQDFLLKTAWMPQITVSMGQQLSGEENAGEILNNLARNDYFVTSKQNIGELVYQYHPLLREFLLSKAEETLSADERNAIQAKGAALFEAEGQIEETIALRVDARNWDEISRIIRENAADMLDQGRGETLEHWLEELPASRVKNDPWMLYWLGATRLAVAPRDSRRLSEQAYGLFKNAAEPDRKGLFSALAGVMDAIIYELDDLTLLDRWIGEAEELVSDGAGFPSPAIEARFTCNTFMSMVFRQPFHPDIEKWGERTAAIAEKTDDPRVVLQMSLILAAGFTWTGRFPQAIATIETMRALSDQPGLPPIVLPTLRNIEAMYFMLVGEHEACMQAVQSSMEIAESTGVQIWRNSTLIYGAGSAMATGDLDRAEELFKQTDQQALASRRFDSCSYHYFKGWQAMLQRDMLTAHQSLRTALRLASEMGIPFFELLTKLALGQVLFHSGDARKGTMYLQQVRTVARTIKNRLLEFTSLLNFAQLALDYGRPRAGMNSLRYALGLGRDKGFMNTLWWQPEVMAPLCARALKEGIEVEYVKSLIRKRKLTLDLPPLDVSEWPWAFKVSTLGRFEILRGDGSNLLSGRGGRPVEVLKTAIAYGATDVSVDRITDVLWPNIDRDYAHRSFNTTLHRLRKLLGEDEALLLTNGQLSLNDKYFWLDTWAVNQAWEDFRTSLRKGGKTPDNERLDELAERVLELYRGPFMPGDEDHPWTISARQQLSTRFLRFIGDLGGYLESNEQFDQALDLYFRGLDADDLAEGLYRRLMLCFQHLGRKAEAIEAYHRCSRTLSARLGVKPSDETTAIYDSLMAAA